MWLGSENAPPPGAWMLSPRRGQAPSLPHMMMTSRPCRSSITPPSDGGSYLRRGDGKAGYLAGIQNHHNPTLRMLPYEEHALKHGAWFFSASNRFVCTGTTASVPEGWLEDVLDRSRFGDVAVWHDEVCIIGDLDPSIVRARNRCGGLCQDDVR